MCRETAYAVHKLIHDPAKAKMLGRLDYPYYLLDALPCGCSKCLAEYVTGWNEAYYEFHKRTT